MPLLQLVMILIVVGVLLWLVNRFGFERGSVHVTAETHERIPLSPILGGLALAGGAILVVVGASSKP